MTPLDALAPDQRAVLELLLRQGRSYGDLSDLLGIPEAAVRERAHAALVSLAPEHAPPAGGADGVADWLLGQQDAATARRTSASLTPQDREWAAAAAGRLRELGGERVPEVPAAGETPRPRPRPVRAAEPTAPAPAAAGRFAGTPRSSRLGGAILIGVLALLIGGALFLLLRGDDDGATPTAGAEQTATPSATPQVISEVAMKGVGGSKAQGLMRVFLREEDGKLVFALAAEQMPPNRGREVYALWFTKRGEAARNLGYSQTQVAEDGVFTTGGPQQGQETDFAKWLVDYDAVVVARASNPDAKRPGEVVLRGTLPSQ